jgi:hypothetical protein
MIGSGGGDRGVTPASFDSAAGFVNALSAVLHDRPFRHLGQGRLAGQLSRATDHLPRSLARRAFEFGGAVQAIRPAALRRVSAQRLARWVVDRYPVRPVDTVFVGSANGAVMHLAAALGAPWLPQTFLLPARRRAAPDDPRADLKVAADEIRSLLAREPELSLHQMHDPNQDALMLGRMAYLRFKLRGLPPAYREHIHAVLPPGGRIVIVDCVLQHPVLRLGDRHVFQPGAVGGLSPEDYLARWDYPTPDAKAPEAEWGFEESLAEDVIRFADRHGHRVARLRFSHPDVAGPFVADAHRRWYQDQGLPADRLLIETFISVEPYWALATRTVPFWTTFPVQASLDAARRYAEPAGRWREIAVTLFANGTRSAGLATAPEWQRLADLAAERGRLVGVDPTTWPVNLGALDRYADDLHRSRPAALLPPRPMQWATARDTAIESPAVEAIGW